MSYYHRTALLGCPGASKSTCGLSYPGVEQHVFGSSEEDTALNFPNRKDILKPLKPDWFDCLSVEEKAKFTDDKVTETEIGSLTKKARAKNIAKYRRYLYGLKTDIPAGKRPELKTIFLDNGTPFAEEFQNYVEVVYANEFMTKGGEFNSIKFSIKYQQEFTDFLRLFYSLPCHTVMSFHVGMTMDEETASKADFMKDTAQGIKRPKEWQPMIYGKAKYVLAGIPTWAFYLWAEENPGQSNRYLAKLEADANAVGLAKSRIQPFDKPSRIELPKNEFYTFLNDAVEKKLKPKSA
jgi:hypothetical protein